MLKQHHANTTHPKTTHRPLSPKSRMTARQRGYTRRWEKARARYLSAHPVCVECEAEGRPRTGNEVDHIIPHMGDQKLFWDEDNWQTLCKTHHSQKTVQERKDWASILLPIISKPLIPVEIVCGPPGSGKTTYCRNNASPNDLVIDLDEIKREVPKGAALLKRAIIRRNQILESLSQSTEYRKAYLIVGAPKHGDRSHWIEQLACSVTVLETAQEVCHERLHQRDGDNAVPGAVDKWFKDYVSSSTDKVIRCT